MGTWLNDDGLTIKYGTTQVDSVKTGEYRHDGPTRVWEIEFDTADVTSSNQIMSYNQLIPSGSLIEKVDILVYEAFAGGTSVDVGLVRDDTTTELDYDGFVDAEVTANLTLGATVSGAGALVNTKLTQDGLPTVNLTGTFTAGKAKVRVYFSQD